MTRDEARKILNAGELLLLSAKFGKSLSEDTKEFCIDEALKIIRKLQEEVG